MKREIPIQTETKPQTKNNEIDAERMSACVSLILPKSADTI